MCVEHTTRSLQGAVCFLDKVSGERYVYCPRCEEKLFVRIKQLRGEYALVDKIIPQPMNMKVLGADARKWTPRPMLHHRFN